MALARLGQSSQRVVALDGDTKNSTFSDIFKKAFPDRYIECFIAEQNMVINIPKVVVVVVAKSFLRFFSEIFFYKLLNSLPIEVK